MWTNHFSRTATAAVQSDFRGSEPLVIQKISPATTINHLTWV